ncbi:hypothetical protein FRC16_010623 [Serendipita sp. 398]|nr:hypothetical protein FRC16_010623 [Serendipita sp. 398]
MDGYNFEQERVFLSWCTETGIRIHPGLQLVFPKKPPTDRDTNSASSPQPPRILAFAARTAPSVAPLVNYRDEDYGSDHDYQDGGSPNELDTADAEGSKDYSGLRVISNLHIKDGTRGKFLGFPNPICSYHVPNAALQILPPFSQILSLSRINVWSRKTKFLRLRSFATAIPLTGPLAPLRMRLTLEALLGARKFPSMHAVVIRAIIGGYLQPLAKTPSIRHPL